ncbi:RDD family protein [Tunturibacter empetritectus]|uniref:RDD family membrane protein YckC n=1 Tax=Tunturiibacter empetritectus TaxID=3069691 RepID=A0A7W8MTY9_9BACT|nr:RDD family protein [Edaphobacter lichenicola]MBB5318719.1 putative RDD family membrane protein YckC [Edaphobacter lichenicola]
MSSAQRDLLPLDETAAETEAGAPFALREQVAQRLAAHRARRTQQSGSAVTPIAQPGPEKSRSSRIAAAVAERYANSPSYRTFLAEQAEAAIREAEAAAEVAALSARAVADAQYQLLADLDQWTLTPPTPAPPALVAAPKLSAVELSDTAALAHTLPATTQVLSPALTVRRYEDATRGPLREQVSPPSRPLIYETYEALNEEETLALDEEIAFRQAPVFEESGPPIEIPANLIEFPRQLVAARKARPRLAEGPLREEADQASHSNQTTQLRIFEVEAAQISTTPVVESVAPEWSSILLAAHPVAAPVETPEAPFQLEHRPEAAPLNLRLMATMVDGCIITASFLCFVAAFALTVGKLSANPANLAANSMHMSLQTAAIGAGGTLAVFSLLYQLLFFTFSEATPGMRYARIGLCTLSDDNPTRSAMRRRIFATVLAACPVGIGFLWAWMDEDGLGWHDRISRMYQRSY